MVKQYQGSQDEWWRLRPRSREILFYILLEGQVSIIIIIALSIPSISDRLYEFCQWSTHHIPSIILHAQGKHFFFFVCLFVFKKQFMFHKLLAICTLWQNGCLSIWLGIEYEIRNALWTPSLCLFKSKSSMVLITITTNLGNLSSWENTGIFSNLWVLSGC